MLKSKNQTMRMTENILSPDNATAQKETNLTTNDLNKMPRKNDGEMENSEKKKSRRKFEHLRSRNNNHKKDCESEEEFKLLEFNSKTRTPESLKIDHQTKTPSLFLDNKTCNKQNQQDCIENTINLNKIKDLYSKANLIKSDAVLTIPSNSLNSKRFESNGSLNHIQPASVTKSSKNEETLTGNLILAQSKVKTSKIIKKTTFTS